MFTEAMLTKETRMTGAPGRPNSMRTPIAWDRRAFLKELGLGGIALMSLLDDRKASGA